jgi:hypothetical protein
MGELSFYSLKKVPINNLALTTPRPISPFNKGGVRGISIVKEGLEQKS